MKFLAQRDLSRQGFIFSFLAGLALWFNNIIPSSAQTLGDALDTTNLVWTTGGDGVWLAQTTNTHDGVDAVRSGVLGSNQTSWIETTIIGPATVHFWSLTTMTPYSPFLGFMVNPDLSGQSLPGQSRPGLIGDWNEWTQDLAQGTNVLRWIAHNYYDTTTQGFVALDELSLSPPRPLTFTDEPDDQTVYAGEVGSGGYGGYSGQGAILFIASAIGTPPFQFQWRKDGTNLAGANAEWLRFTNVTQADAGNYSLVVSNSQGFIVSSNALLTVLPPTPPFWVYEPASVEVYSGQTVYMQGGVNGSQPFTFQWRKDGTNLPGPNSPWLMLTNLSLADAGNYTLLVTNKNGSVESSNAVLTVIPSIAPLIIKHPRSLEVAAGVNTWMSVSATGTPAPCCIWARTDVAPPPPTFPPIPAICQYTMRWFDNVSSNDAGVYRATLSNSGGTTASREALLTVLPPIKVLGSWSQGAEDIYVTNGLAFLAQGSNGLAILSISNPASPVLLGSYNTPGFASAVQTVGDRAYVADGVSGLQIISVTNPSNPVLLGNYNTPYSANDVAVRDNLAYVADGNSGLRIISVSNPAAPSLIGSYSTNASPKHIAVSGNYAYLTSPDYVIVIGGSNYWVGGMLIVDISNPLNPIAAGRHGWPDGKIAVQDGFVYSASGWGMSVLDARNPSMPQYVGGYSQFEPNWQSYDIQLANERAYLLRNSDSNMNVLVLDIHNPTDAIPVGSYSVAGRDRALFVEGNRVYSGGNESPFKVIETPFNTNPVLPAMLTLSAAPGMQLSIHGRRGLNYALETATAPVGQTWQVLQTFLLTNDTASVSVSPSPTMGFFRLKQLD